MLFLLSSGLTLILGVMNFANFSHGTFYMAGAYIGALTYAATSSIVLSFFAMIVGVGLVGAVLEMSLFRRLYRRDHLDQVLATFAVIMFANEATKTLLGAGALFAPTPSALSGFVEFGDFRYPAYRIAIIALGAVVAVAMYLLVHKTRAGMLVRAGASDREMVELLGMNIRRLYSGVFVIGAILAGLAGFVAAPIYTVQPGMGELIIVVVLVVIVIGGMGSIKGAFFGAILVGLVDTFGRVFFKPIIGLAFPPYVADTAASAAAAMAVYALMIAVLVLKPNGLFSGK
jgi:branched-chain amino acid transport system permease protein